MWVQIVETDRCYGGPEEGGWYYDATFVVFERKLKRRLARKLAKRLAAEVGVVLEPGYRPGSLFGERPAGGRHDRFSVLGGTDVSVRCGSYRERTMTERPSYC